MTSMYGLLLGMLAVVVCKVAIASLAPEEEGLSIIHPSYARKNIYVAMANFGVPKYGGFLSGELVYVSSEGRYYQNETFRCHPRDCQYGCDLQSAVPASQPMAEPGLRMPKKPGTSYIMLVERGPKGDGACFFLDKIYNAQLAGADAVLVANYPGENLTTAIAPDTNDTATERAQLTVSAGMISWEDAQMLKLLLANVTATAEAAAAGGGPGVAGGGVQLLLNWTRSVPQTTQVSWEIWTSSEDVCGGACSERTNFTMAIKSQAVALEQSSLTKFTPRYFLYACKEGTNNETACVNNCFSGGRYCGWPNVNNYTGKDVLRMNLRAKCFFTQAAANGRGYLWWDYVTAFATNCSITNKAYNEECAARVFDSLNFPGSSKAAWEACAKVNESDPVISILEEELQAQYGNYTDRTVAEVKINPTIRINGEQYRGSLESGPVLRMLCAAFRSGYEPGICNSPSISDDECAGPYGEGYVRCGVGTSGNRSRCINTFQGYQCACGSGFQVVFEPGDPFSEGCDDINECLVSRAPFRRPDCSCERCACINEPGSYRCSNELPNLCVAAEGFNGCWSNTSNGRTYSNCVDNIREYQDRAARGLLKEGEKWAKCGDCPKCFRPVSDDSFRGGLRCEPLCDLSACDEYWGFCRGGAGGSKDEGGTTTGDRGVGGVHLGVLVLVALGAAALTGVVVLAANQLVMRRRMGAEIREIMGAYMPLQEGRTRSAAAAAAAAGARSGGGGGGAPERERIIRPDEDSDEEDGQLGPYGWSTGRTPAATATAPAAAAPALVGASQRAVWGPPVATSAAGGGGGGGGSPPFASGRSPIPLSSTPSSSAAASAAASAALRPTVEAVPAAADSAADSAAGAAAGASDPLLGLSLVSSSSLEASGPRGDDPKNPFL